MVPTPVPPCAREAFVQEWVRRTLDACPAHAARRWRAEQDPFRNPAGHVLVTALGRLADELLGAFDPARAAVALEPLVRLRAVQDTGVDGPTGFVALAREAARSGPPIDDAWLDLLDARLMALAAMAGACLERCRHDIDAIGARAVARRTWLPDRMRARAAAHAASGPGPVPAATRGDA